MRYRIALHHSEDGVSVSVPGLPGCWSQGVNEEEAIEEYIAIVEEKLLGEDVRLVEVTV